MSKLSGKTVLITGGTGSFGRTMLNHLLKTDVKQVRVFSRDEEKQDALRNSLREKRVEFYIGDIRERRSVDVAMAGVDYVFHAAALKQVPSCEFFPLEAVMTNIHGSANVIASAVAHGVESVVCLSTDKAVLPVNAMGMTKSMMEKIALAEARRIGENGTKICCVRYGNVIYSRGSVLPLFVRQIKAGEPLTITDPTMTRFLMPLRDAVDLVEFALLHAEQGAIFVRKAAACRIDDLATATSNIFGKPANVEIIGSPACTVKATGAGLVLCGD